MVLCRFGPFIRTSRRGRGRFGRVVRLPFLPFGDPLFRGAWPVPLRGWRARGWQGGIGWGWRGRVLRLEWCRGQRRKCRVIISCLIGCFRVRFKVSTTRGRRILVGGVG